MRKATLHQLRIFQAVARHKNYTRAGEELCLSQSSVSEQIKELTEIIGFPLLEHVGKQLYVTEVGTKLLELYRSIDAHWGGLYEYLAHIHGLKQGCLQLSAVTTAQYFIPDLLGSFIKELPSIEVILKIVPRPQLQERMRNNIDDLYIFGQVPQDIEIKTISLAENPLVVLARPDHPLAGKINIEIGELQNEIFMTRETGSDTCEAVRKYFRSRKTSMQRLIEMGGNEAIKQGIVSGLGISILSQYTVIQELKTGQLVMLDVEGFPIINQWHVGYLAGKEPVPVARYFLDQLKEQRHLFKAKWVDRSIHIPDICC